MRKLCVLVTALALVSVGSLASAQEFSENFDSYASGMALHGVGGWKGWGNASSAGAPVSSKYAYSGKNSVEIVSTADLVHEFTANGGLWEFSAMQYIPSGTTGESYFILLNQYDDAATANDWSIQTKYILGTGAITPWSGATGDGAILYDRWVRIQLIIDLDNNTCQEYYNGTLIASETWDGDKHTTLRAVDLYGNSASSIYYDDIKLAVYVPYRASAPSPTDGEIDVIFDTQLSWSVDDSTATHTVYLGTVFADVSEASTSDPRGVLVSDSQSGTTFDAGQLEYGQTYYWRVDEVGGTLGGDLVKGEVWSFTVESFSYVLNAGSISVTASSAAEGSGPEKTIDGSGLVDDQHSTELTDMWLTPANALPAWIQYEFDKEYKLYELWVWNSNYSIESVLGYGAKDVVIEYSTDGQTWAQLQGVPQFTQATGQDSYTANTVVNLSEITAKYVKLTIIANWGGFLTQTSLSEVRFFYVPVQAYEPDPADGETGVSPNATLQWRPGREATSHKVYLGTDSNAVADGIAPVATVTDHSYTPGALDMATTYYWKADEIGDTGTYEGDVWSFTTEKYVTVDNFESYNDSDNCIYDTWLDGYVDKSSGSQVGYLNAPFAETTIVNSGLQSMPLAYSNTASLNYSEAVRTFGTSQDWTGSGAESLTLYFFGGASNTGAGQLYVKINSTKVLYDGSASDLQLGVWLPWTIDLSSTGVSLKKVTSLTIGVSGSGSAGLLFIDDIRLYADARATLTPVDPGTTGLVAYYPFNGDAKDAKGTHHGTATGSPSYTTGKVGQALQMTSDSQYITAAYAADLAMNTFTVAAWVNVAETTGIRGILGTRIGGEYTFDLKVQSTGIHADVGSGTAWLNSSVYVYEDRGGLIATNAWCHIACIVDDATDTVKTYINGVLAGTATFSGTPLFMKSGESLGIGCCYTGEYMHGLMDEVRIYNRVLSDAEVVNLAGRTGTIYVAP
jgi:hypothetical protein